MCRPLLDSTATPAVVTHPFITPVRLDGLGSKCDPVHSPPDIIKQVEVGAAADDMAEAEVSQAWPTGTDTHGVEKIPVTAGFDVSPWFIYKFDRNPERLQVVVELPGGTLNPLCIERVMPVGTRKTDVVEHHRNSFA